MTPQALRLYKSFGMNLSWGLVYIFARISYGRTITGAIQLQPAKQNFDTTPPLFHVPSNADPRLVDRSLLHPEAWQFVHAERYRRGEIPHTIHVWWARRPHSAMRAWDYMETDPLMQGPGNLWGKLERIIAGVKHLSALHAKAEIRKGRAHSLPCAGDSFDAVVTDPPYYDNIFIMCWPIYFTQLANTLRDQVLSARGIGAKIDICGNKDGSPCD
jgi:hypothetical protein